MPGCEPVVGELTSVEGVVRVQRSGNGSWQEAGVGATLCDKDTVRAEANSRAAVSLINDAVFRIDQNTAVHLADIAPEPEEKSFVQLLVGAIQSFSRKPREVAIDTPYLNATIEGTEFVIRVAENETQLTVFEGTVRAANPQGEEAVTSGQMVVAQAGQAPQRRVVVRPRDAAQWSIYYPPVVAAMGGAQPPADLSPAMAEAADLAGQGNAAGALEAMDRVPAGQQDARYHLYRASFLLAAGQVGEARGAIDRALQADANSSLAYALRAVIDVAQNRKDEALANGRRAVELAPDSAAAAIALSYALQANYQLGEARQTLERAVAANPDDALARARLAELWMMVGYRDRARAEAEKAVEIAPNLERAQVVLGFANLVEIRTTQAKAAFNKAITIDSDDPMAHLGLGLAMIREGDLAEGRKQIEAAVALDPESALLRSYLGKAYFEEKREEIDAQQLAMAKEFDPNDPTAYLYDALRKQSENRPGEALQDLQKSIELNDNRAVYRGRLQLDEDRAARGASLARVYNDLGFNEVGLNEASKSLSLSPSDASAHRFMSDAYKGVRRREIARVSELLQAQLLQDVNINPVQPSSSETNLNIVSGGGPAEAGFNEFTPLFERNQAQLNVTGLVGNNDTYGGEGVVSAVYDQFSISAGVFHHETDGFRDNHDIDHDIYNVYAQAAVTPELNLQAEYRRRETEFGDLELNFDPDDFLSDKITQLDQDIFRFGARYSPSPGSDVLLSVIYSDREEAQSYTVPDEFLIFDTYLIESQVKDKGYQAEGQYIFSGDRLDILTGLGYSSVDSELDATVTAQGGILGPGGELVVDQVSLMPDITHPRGYIYANVNVPEAVTWTLGASYDSFKEKDGGADIDEFNPKFGVQVNVTDRLLLRGAWFEAVKPALVNNRTIEPTQVAGFNQLFDDINATRTAVGGVGIDWQAADNFFLGAEATWRDLDVPSTISGSLIYEDQDEQVHRLYANWLPLTELALSAGFVYDKFTAEAGDTTDFSSVPLELTTVSVPVEARYFHPSGFFASLGATYVDQEVERSDLAVLLSGFAEGDDQFVTVGASVGYRLPNRLGVVGLQVTNLLDEEFKYQDDSFREFRDEPSSGPYIPDRSILFRATLNW